LREREREINRAIITRNIYTHSNATLYLARANVSIAVLYMLDDGDPWQKFILASFFVGYAIPQVYAGYLAQKYGGYRVLLSAASLWTIATITSVPAYHYGGPMCLCLCRVLVGLAEGCNYPSQMALALKWFPMSERTTLWMLLGSGEAAGTILAMSTSSQIATTIGWSYIFFISGAVGAVFVLVFYFFASKDPESHTFIQDKERDMIVQKRPKKLSPFQNKIPWYNIVTYRPFLATCCAHFAYNYQACVDFFSFVYFLSESLKPNQPIQLSCSKYRTILLQGAV
jgi:MFS family permease